MIVLVTNVKRPFSAALFSLWESLHQILFFCCEFLVNVSTKGLLLMSTTPTLSIVMAEIAVLLVLDMSRDMTKPTK